MFKKLEDVENYEECSRRYEELVKKTILFTKYNLSPINELRWFSVLDEDYNFPLLANVVYEVNFLENLAEWGKQEKVNLRVGIYMEHTLERFKSAILKLFQGYSFETMISESRRPFNKPEQFDMIIEVVEAKETCEIGKYDILCVLYDNNRVVHGWLELENIAVEG
jgi:hypothetical protein